MGQVIAGRFELAEHIASGGSGSIWRAWDRRRNAWCAAKVLRQKDSAELLRFVREQGIQLDHAHLATPYGWAAEDEDVAIAMPLVCGGTLGDALNDHGAFSSALTAQMLLQLLDGLAHVHAAGWIHRDVKPANILLEPTGEGTPHLRLGDFGIAVREDDPRLTSMGWVNGTPGYLAPEVMDLAAPAPAQDLYAAGVVALRMLDPALAGERELTRALLDPRRTLGDIPGVDPRLVFTVAALLDEDPQERVRAAEQAGRSLDLLARPTTAAGGFLTAGGEPFVVFDVLGAPDGAVPAGPEPASSAGPTARPAPQTGSGPTVPAPPSRIPSVGVHEVSSGGDGSSSILPPERSGSPLIRALPWVLIVTGLVAVVVALALVWPRGEADDAGTVTPAPGASTTDSASSPTVSSTAPQEPTQDPTSEPAEPGSPQAPTPTETTPSTTAAPTPTREPRPTQSGVPIRSSVQEGDSCTWLEEGLVVTGADGQRLVCEHDGSRTVWASAD